MAASSTLFTTGQTFPISQAKRKALEDALRETGGDVDLTAKRLGTKKWNLCGLIVRCELEDVAVMPWRDVNRPRLVSLLERHNWSPSRVARVLRCSPAQIHRLVDRWSIEMPGRDFEDSFQEVTAAGRVVRRLSLPLAVYRRLWDIRAQLASNRTPGGVGLGAAMEHVMEENRRLRELAELEGA